MNAQPAFRRFRNFRTTCEKKKTEEYYRNDFDCNLCISNVWNTKEEYSEWKRISHYTSALSTHMWWFISLLKRGKGRQHYWRWRRWRRRRRRWILESVHTSWKMKKIKPPHESFMFYTCFTVQWHLLFSLVVLGFNVYRARHIDCKYFHENSEFEHTMAFLHCFDVWFWKCTSVKFVYIQKLTQIPFESDADH